MDVSPILSFPILSYPIIYAIVSNREQQSVDGRQRHEQLLPVTTRSMMARAAPPEQQDEALTIQQRQDLNKYRFTPEVRNRIISAETDIVALFVECQGRSFSELKRRLLDPNYKWGQGTFNDKHYRDMLDAGRIKLRDDGLLTHELRKLDLKTIQLSGVSMIMDHGRVSYPILSYPVLSYHIRYRIQSYPTVEWVILVATP